MIDEVQQLVLVQSRESVDCVHFAVQTADVPWWKQRDPYDVATKERSDSKSRQTALARVWTFQSFSTDKM